MGLKTSKAILTAACLSAGVFFVHAEASACGGTFCGQPPPDPAPPAPVDQTGERIVFVVAGNTVTAHVQIQYTGSADAFAWVVPVPEVPVVAESSEELFMELDLPTALQVRLPMAEPCPQSSGGGGGGGISIGCGGADSLAFSPEGFNEPAPMEPPVTRYGMGVTDNYSYDIVGAETAEVLVAWLADNGYNVSDNMVPVMRPYEGAEHKFLALKLRDGKQASDIVPIEMSFAAKAPMIPIQLTRVAAQPFMGISVFIVGDSPFYPSNYKHIRPRASELLFDGSGLTNYFDWVARTVDENDGHLFITEFVGPAPQTSRFAGKTLSRFYTRMSPEHMTLDPVFEAFPGGAERSNEIDLTGRLTVRSCGQDIRSRLPSACAFNYCGAGATCAETDRGKAACICPDGQASQSVPGPDGNARVACVPENNPFGVVMPPEMAGTIADPCLNKSCGNGSCLARSGFAVCVCNDAQLAVPAGESIACIAPPENMKTFGPGAGLESKAAIAMVTGVPTRAAMATGAWGVLVGLWALRRRRRRC